MYTPNLIGKSDRQMIDIITNAEKTAEQWEEAKHNLLIKPRDDKDRNSKKDKFQVSKKYKKLWKEKDKEKIGKEKKDKKSRINKERLSWFTETIEGITNNELDRQRKEKEYMGCVWPLDWKRSHSTTDYYR
jgi:hypothetical protein